MPEQLTKRQEAKLLDAISSLKRAAGIEDAWLQDHVGDGRCNVCTQSKESFQIMQNLLSQAFSQNHTEKYWRNHPGEGLHEQIKAAELEGPVFMVGFPVDKSTLNIATERVAKMTEKLIAPTVRKR